MIEIRYFSKFGHSERMAKVVGEVTGATPQLVSVPLQGEVDTLYLGTGVFLGKIHAEVVDFIKTLTPDKVKRVVCFGSCAIIKSPVPQMRKLLEAQGVKVETREFTCRGSMGPLHAGHPNDKDMKALKEFVKATM